MSTGKIELSVGTTKIANKYEIFTEEEIDAINNKIPELDERVGVIEDEIEEINSSLDNMKTYNIPIGSCPWISGTSLATKKLYIDSLVSSGLKYFEFCATIINNNGVYSILETDDEINELLDYADSKGIKPFMCKIHQKNCFESDYPNFRNNYLPLVKKILKRLEKYNIEYVSLFNELWAIYKKVENEVYAINIIKDLQQMGYKVSISVAGIQANNGGNSYHAMTENLKNTIDYICLNYYLEGTKSDEPVTVIENLKCINSNISNNFNAIVQEAKKNNKKIIISETGCADYWLALHTPGVSGYNSECTQSYGKAPNIYLECMFEYFKNYLSDLIAIFVWYIKFDNEKAQEIVKHYCGGGE